MEILSKSKIITHPAYPKILQLYNEEFARTNGRLSDNRFFEEVVKREIKDTSRAAWYNLLKRVKTKSGMTIATPELLPENPPVNKLVARENLEKTLVSNEIATQNGINSALNLGLEALQTLLADPVKMSQYTPQERQELYKRSELLFKAMKSQDSRIHAIGKIKQDNRDEARFNRAFSQDGYRNE